MRNEAWFYSGVRYAKDGRYCCFCPTPATKRTVLLAGATLTYAYQDDGGNANSGFATKQITPFNVDKREITVSWVSAGMAQSAQQFLESNYFIFHSMDTGAYYFYYVDYIEPYQQIDNTESQNLKTIRGGDVFFRVGLSVDYWQTYFFKMRTKLSSQTALPAKCPPHSTASDTVNEVIMPSYDFMNVERTNIGSILEYIYAHKARHFRPTRVSKVYTLQAQQRRFRIIDTDTSVGFGILAKMSISATEAAARTGGTYWVWIDQNFKQWQLSNAWNGNALGWLNTVLTSTGKTGNAYDDTTVGLQFANGSNYKILEAYFIPNEIANQLLPMSTIRARDHLIIVPTNYSAQAFSITAYIVTPFNVPMSMLNSSGARYDINTTRAAVTFSQLRTYLNACFPSAGNSAITKLLPFLSVGTDNEKIAAIPCIPSTVNDNGYCAPNGDFEPETVMFWIEMRLSPYNMNLILTNGDEEVNIAPAFSLPLREVTDSEEIERQKQSYELGNISKGIGLLSSGIGLAGSVATGNVVGAVMSTAQIASQGVSLFNSVSNAPDFSKQMRENVTNNTNNFSTFIIGVFLFIPSQFTLSNNTPSAIVPTYYEEYTEIGIEVGAIFRNSDTPTLKTLLAPTTSQVTGFIQGGCVLLNMPQEAGEILERRLREGVSFWYV